MKPILLLLASGVLFLGGDSATKLNYPIAPKGNQVDDYHGTKIADPYRGLENADAASTEKFVEQENALTFGYLAKLPGREAIKKQLTDLWNYEKFGGFHKAGNHYFYFHNSGLQNQSVLYVTDSLTVAGTRAAGSEHVSQGRDGGAGWRVGELEWEAVGLCGGAGGFGLGGVARARRGYRQGFVRPDPVDQRQQRFVGGGRSRVLLFAFCGTACRKSC